MTKKDFLGQLEKILEANEGSIHGGEAISDLEGWDSIAALSFIAMLDEQIGVTVPATKIAEAKTVRDLISLVGDKITD